MRVLGLSAGNRGGSAEILLSAALQAAEAAGAEVALVSLDDLRLPTRPVGPADDAADDDGQWLWDRVMDAAGIIVSAPIYSRTIPGKLKLVADRLAGPAADVAFAESYRAMLAAGQTPPVAFPYDERVFAPRVAGLIAVGGALTSQWRSLALPLMHQMMFSAQIAVADQLLVGGAGMPRSVVLDEAALRDAARVGHSVGSQLGRSFDAVQYRGDPGLCPLCHLSVVTIEGAAVQCATCGAGGRLAVSGDQVRVVFDDLEHSVIGLEEKRAHFAEVQETAQRLGTRQAEIDALAARYDRTTGRITPDQSGRRAIA